MTWRMSGVLGVALWGVSTTALALSPYLTGAVGSTNYGVEGADHALALHLGLGIEFSPNLAAEGGFLELGKADLRGGGELRVAGVEFGGIGAWPVGARSHLYARGGFYVWEFSDDSVHIVDEDGNTDPYLGLGLRYEYSDQMFLFTDYSQYFLEFDEDPLVWAAGAGTRF
jgi:hypothetical protein